MTFLIALLASAASATTTPPAVVAPADSTQQETKEAKAPEKICRTVALNSESRRKERLCLTSAEWRELNNPR